MILQACGRVTNDLELKMGKKDLYVRFSVAVNTGHGETRHTVFLECWAFGDMAARLTKGKVGKGAAISVVGETDLVEVKRKDGTKDKVLKLIVSSWEYPPTAKPKSEPEPKQPSKFEDKPIPEEPPIIDGDAGYLP